MLHAPNMLQSSARDTNGPLTQNAGQNTDPTAHAAFVVTANRAISLLQRQVLSFELLAVHPPSHQHEPPPTAKAATPSHSPCNGGR